MTLSLTLASRAERKPFWHDEIYTILVSNMGSLGEIRLGLLDGLDLQPPLNTLATRVVHQTIGAGPVRTRLAPILAFVGATALVFAIGRSRAAAPVGLASALFLCFTAAFRYGYEARGYALMVFCFSAALWSWMAAAAGRRRRLYLPLLAVSVAAGVWSHYFAALALLPIGAGELARLAQRRRVDRGVAGALVAAGALASPMVRLAHEASSQAATFWTRASLADIGPTYTFLLNRAIDWPVIVAAALGIAVARAWRRTAAPEDPPRGPASHEWVALAAAALVPAGAVVLGVVASGVFSDHYAMAGVVGLSLALPMVVWWAGGRRAIAVAPLLLLLAFRFAEGLPSAPWPGRGLAPSPALDRPLLMRALAAPDGLPVAVNSALPFLQLWYYAPAEQRARVRFLSSPVEALKRGPSDTTDRGLAALARWVPVPVEEFERFRRAHSEFRVYAFGGGWLIDALRASGAELEAEGRELGAVLYRVKSGSPVGVPGK